MISIDWNRRVGQTMKSIPQAFDDFRRALELTANQKTVASAQQNRVRGLDGYRRDFLTGSYKRRTCLRPLDDIDFFVVFDGARNIWDGKPSEAPDALMRRVRAALDAAWPTKDKPKLQMRSLNVEFTGTGIGYDVVPAYSAEQGGFWIPDRESGWIRSDPTVHEAKLTKVNGRTSGQLVPLIKLVKQWRREHKRAHGKVPFTGFHLETLLVRRHDAWRPPALRGDLASDLADALEHIATAIIERCPDPAGLGPDLTHGVDVYAAQRVCVAAARIAREAENARYQGVDERAHQLWSGLLGSGYAFR